MALKNLEHSGTWALRELVHSEVLYLADSCMRKIEYVMTLKKWKPTPFKKMMVEKRKVSTVLLLFFKMHQKYTKDVYMMRVIISLTIDFRHIKGTLMQI